MRFSPEEADLKAYLGMFALHVRVFSLPQVASELPHASSCTIVVISKEPGTTVLEAAKPGFGRN